MTEKLPVLLIFAKQPMPGQVKTRFLPDTTPEIAAAIALDFIELTVKTATIAWPGPIRLTVSPDFHLTSLESIARQYNIELANQSEGNLGTKMEAAISETLRYSPAAAIIGCDIPSLSVPSLQYAFSRLQEGKNVLGPSADGGFYFVGLLQSEPGMFDGILWGTNEVLNSTIMQLNKCQINIDVMLSCLQDIDTWNDFRWMTKFHPDFQIYLRKFDS